MPRKDAPSSRPSAAGPTSRPAARMVPAPRRRIFSPLFVAGGVFGILLIFFGVYLLANTTSTPASTPTPRPPVALLNPSPRGPVSAGPTLPPVGTVETAAPITTTPLPSITPSPSYTPGTVAPPTATLPAPSAYTLFFEGEGRGAGTGIYEIKGDGTGERAILTGNEAFRDVAVSFDNHIAYVSLIEGKPQLFVATADGKNAQAITKLTGDYVGSPTWSGDSRFIAFVSNEPGNKEIYMIDADGQNLKRLTDNKVDDIDPDWSPKGDKLAFASDPSGRNLLQIFILTLSTNKLVQLTNATGSSYSPVWSPDAAFLAVVSTRDRYENIYIVDSRDGTRSRLLTIGGGQSASRDPAWSPDGRYIAFASNRNTPKPQLFNLFLTSVDAKALLQVTTSKDDKASSYGVRFKPGL